MRPSRAHAPQALRGGIARETRTVLFGGARRRRLASGALTVVAIVCAIVLVATVPPARARTAPPDATAIFAPYPPGDDGQGDSYPAPLPVIAWRASRAVGLPWAGRLVHGVQLPASGPDWFTWDGVRNYSPSRGWRRWGTDALLRTTIHVLREYRDANPDAPRVGIGDLSREQGGHFGREFGGLGHASHQNGLDIDVWYPRLDRQERRAFRPRQVDQDLAQELVDLFVRAGAQKIFVGPHLHLTGPRNVVIELVHHDDHLHVRIPPPPE